MVKKYHPDLQEGDKKKEAEETIKYINEAYSVLSDAIKKAEYDATLKDDNVSKEEYDRLKQELNNMKHNSQANNNQNYEEPNYYAPPYSKQQIYRQQPAQPNQPDMDNFNAEQEKLKRQQEELQYRQQLERARQKAYHDAYIQDLRNRGYKIRYKKSFKDYVRIAITVIVLIVILVILWHIPPVHNFFVNLYYDNEIIKFIVDVFFNIIDAIMSIFK